MMGALVASGRWPLRLDPAIDVEAVLRAVGDAETRRSSLIRGPAKVIGIGLILSLTLFPWGTLAYVVMTLGWGWAGVVARAAYRPESPWRVNAGPAVGLWITVAFMALVLGLPVGAWRVVIALSLHLITVLVAAALLGIRLGEAVSDLRDIGRRGPPEAAEVMPSIAEALDWARASQPANLDLFGSYQPFEAPIERSRSWSITVDLTRGVYGQAVQGPIAVEYVYKLLAERLRGLGMRGLRVDEIAYVPWWNVQSVPNLRRSADSRMLPLVDEAVLRAAERQEVALCRPYLRLRVEQPGGLPMALCHVRVAVDGSTLHLEVHHSRGHWVRWDLLGRASAPVRAGQSEGVGSALLELAADALRLAFGKRCSAFAVAQLPQNAIAAVIPTSGPPTYFDEIDAMQAREMIDRQVLSSVDRALEEAGVDTSEFSRRSSTVLNMGTIVSGNTVQGGVLGVGTGNSLNLRVGAV
jgi:hypothetical protein